MTLSLKWKQNLVGTV